jgi:hypothetical protein
MRREGMERMVAVEGAEATEGMAEMVAPAMAAKMARTAGMVVTEEQPAMVGMADLEAMQET